SYDTDSATFTVKFEKLAIDPNASTFVAFDEGDRDSTIPGLYLKIIKEGRSLYLTMTNKTKVAKGKEAQRKKMLTLDSGNTIRWAESPEDTAPFTSLERWHRLWAWTRT
ncbi:hypothetical protein THAOC_07657, partial [Thalassiosira oceanica]